MSSLNRLLGAAVCVAGLAACADDPDTAGSPTTAGPPTTGTAPTTATTAVRPAASSPPSSSLPDTTAVDQAGGTCRSAEDPVVVPNGDARISVRTVGTGTPVVMIPSLARGASDFDQLAADLAARGRMAILPDPRGIDGSTGPAPTGLADLADDAAAVIAELCDGPVDVVGHAFGQRVTRMLAARHPDQVNQVVILAAGGRVPMADDVRQSLITSLSEGSRPDDERLQALQHVFFAAGQDPAQWLTGWTPEAAALQSAATQATNIDDWWGGGSAPILAVQATEDPIAPAANSADLAAEFGERIRVVQLPHASHAILPEQPASVTAVVDAYLSGERDQATLQAAVDRNIVIPSNS